jgi:Flp pilus assembly pilin Flp
MNTLLLRIYLRFQDFASREQGQDMVEYALVLGLLSFGITAASNFLAASLASAFNGLNTNLGSYIS